MKDRKIVAYEMLKEGTTISNFNDRCNDLIDRGYQPHGLPFCTQGGAMCQAFVKYADEIKSRLCDCERCQNRGH